MADIVVEKGLGIKTEGLSLPERAALAGLRVTSRLLKPTYFKGYGRIAAILKTAAPARHIVLELDADCCFRFPFGDAYWSRLLAPSVVYEPEMHHLFRLIRDETFLLIDCGANFGYWSLLVSGQALGAHEAVAIEASARNAGELARNAALNHDRFSVVHAAVADIDGGFVTLEGPTHEVLAIVDADHAGAGAEQAPRATLDGLMARNATLQRHSRFVLKLDVEGVEEAALKGAGELLSRDTLLIYEEQGSDRSHANTRFVTRDLDMSVFVFDGAGFREARNPLSTVEKMKKNRRRGYNLVATRSPTWAEFFRRHDPSSTLDRP